MRTTVCDLLVVSTIRFFLKSNAVSILEDINIAKQLTQKMDHIIKDCIKVILFSMSTQFVWFLAILAFGVIAKYSIIPNNILLVCFIVIAFAIIVAYQRVCNKYIEKYGKAERNATVKQKIFLSLFALTIYCIMIVFMCLVVLCVFS